MSHCTCHPEIQPYHDGELPADRLEPVRQHADHCVDCSRELRQLRDLSGLLAGDSSEEMTPAELGRLHAAVDGWIAGAQPRTLPFPWVKALAAAAASILIIASAWMAELPRSQPVPAVPSIAAAQDWERIAATLQVDPPPPGLGEPGLADAEVADWFLRNLEEKGAHANN